MNNYVGSKAWLLVAAALLAAVAGVFLPWGRGARSALTEAHVSAGVIYVDANASAAEPDGLSWTTAFTELQAALAVAVSGDQIWVAEGVYKPDFDPGNNAYTGDVTATFALTNGVKLYGGFSGGMSTLTERLPEVYLTILSGDLEGDDQTDARHLITDTAYISGTNAYHVVTAIGVDGTAVLDGFFVTGGQAFGVAPDDVGGGMHNQDASPAIVNMTFIGNRANSGGGMRNDNAHPALVNVTFTGNRANSGGGMANRNGSSPTLSHVVFAGNQAIGAGGGMINRDGSSPVLFDAVFTGNRANFGGGMVNWGECTARLTNVVFTGNVADLGGAIQNIQSSPILFNVALSGNYASITGGAIGNAQSAPHLVNVTLNGNAAGESGGGVYNGTTSMPSIQNSIVWGNQDGTWTVSAQIGNSADSVPVISDTLVQASGGSAAWDTSLGVDGGGNLDADPQFIAPVNAALAPTSGGNLRLTFGSPAMDAGDNAAVLSAVDLDGKPRVVAPAVDMGAYEVEGICYATIHAADTVLFVYNSTTGIAVQQAVDAASAGQTVKVAGHCIGGATTQQTVYITKSLTLRGGYAPDDWAVSAPLTHPTTLDAAGEGRVVYIDGPADVVLENLRLTNGFLGNVSNSRGGAVRVADATAVISGCEVISNTAATGGGVAFTGNSSGRVVNTLLARNTANEGTALWTNASGLINLVHTTIAVPSLSLSSAVYATVGTTRLTNVIIANHATGVVQDGSAAVWEDYTLFYDVTTPTSGNVSGGSNSIMGNPYFVAPASDDYRLSEDSAAIDAGVDADVYVDFQGDPRPMGAGFDIGYDEFTGSSFFTVYLPLVLRN